MDSYSPFIKIVFWFAFGLIFFVKSGEPGGMSIMFCIENNSQNELKLSEIHKYKAIKIQY